MTRQQKIARLRRLIRQTHQAGVHLSATLRQLRWLNQRRRARLAVLLGTDPHRKPPRPRFGLDYAWGAGAMPDSALQRIGATFVCRYFSRDPSKNLTRQEARHLARLGIDKVVVWETTANRAGQGHDAGAADAQASLAEGRATGMPASRPHFLAVDFDAQGPDIHDYFAGASEVLGRGRRGAYAGITVIRYLFDHGLIDYGWQTYAWSGGQWDPRAQLRQYSNGHNVGGVDTDYNIAIAADFGQWR